MQFTVYQAADLAGMEKSFRANFINSLSGFKSVNLVGTVSPVGVTNLAIFSQVFHLGASPALMGLLVRPDTVPRDTLTNLLATGYFTLNHITPEFYQAAHQTSGRYTSSEFVATGLSPEISPLHPAPYVAEAQVKIGLKFIERHDLAINGTVLIIGQVVETIIQADCIATDGYIDLEKAQSITCSGLDSYHTTQRLARLTYAKPNQANTTFASGFLVGDEQPPVGSPIVPTTEIVAELNRLAGGLLYISESEHPFTVEIIAEPSLDRSLDGPSIDDFFTPVATVQSWHNESEQQVAERFRQLASAIKEKLQERFLLKSDGAPLKAVQIMGKVNNDWICITTKVVET